jgi:hypothetical protein
MYCIVSQHLRDCFHYELMRCTHYHTPHVDVFVSKEQNQQAANDDEHLQSSMVVCTSALCVYLILRCSLRVAVDIHTSNVFSAPLTLPVRTWCASSDPAEQSSCQVKHCSVERGSCARTVSHSGSSQLVLEHVARHNSGCSCAGTASANATAVAASY